MTIEPEQDDIASRRNFLARSGQGFGLLALAELLAGDGFSSLSNASTARAAALGDRRLNPLAPQPTHFAAKAKNVIWLFMNGGQSHVDTWDYKPELAKRDGKDLEGFDKNTGFFANAVGPLMKSPFKF